MASPIVEILLGKLLSIREVLLEQGIDNNELESLKKILSSIRRVLFDAEIRQFHEDAVRRCLKNLEDACYTAEDMLEDVEVEALCRQLKEDGHHQNRSITKKVCGNFISYSKSISDSLFPKNNVKQRFKKNKDKLEYLMNIIQSLKLRERVHDDINRNVCRVKETSQSFVDASSVIDRGFDKENIIRTLPQNLHVDFGTLAIVGDSGIGKTTLAKLVYSDQRIDSYFDIKMWARFPSKFVEKKMIIDMIYSVTGHIESNMEMEELQKMLQGILKSRKYLLVLDDVLIEDKRKWNEFISLLSVGAKESRIIVITSSKEVASMVGTLREFSINLLPRKSVLSLFMMHAFEKDNEKKSNLKKIGEEIAEKCSGCPLVVKMLASTLNFSTNEEDWKYVKDKLVKIEDGDLNASSILELSYGFLPSHLKICVVYCSIFPKDYELNNIILIQFWIANGLLQSNTDENDQDLEFVGMRYIYQLRDRCFFQDFEQNFGFICFKMHDLVHHFVTKIAKKECLKLEVYRNNLRRSILFHGMTPSKSVVRLCILENPKLRALDLRNSEIDVLPESIGKLKHLRYLNLTKCIKMKRLPRSIVMLKSLETLLLGGCKGLEALPGDIRHLVRLRMLVFSSKQTRLPQNGIGCLTSLRCLGIGSCYNLEHLIEDIGSLQALRTLIIRDCPKLVSLPPSLKDLNSLEKLLIFCCEEHGGCKLNMEMKCSDEQLTTVKPRLRMLCIDGLPKFHEMPQWLLQCSANSTLEWLAIKNCRSFMKLPADPLQILKSLEVLEISSCPNLSSLPEDMDSLTAIRELKIRNCEQLSKRCKFMGEDWSKISHITKIEVDGKQQQGLVNYEFPGDRSAQTDHLIWMGSDVARNLWRRDHA